MKTRISRQSLYLSVISVFLLFFVLLFSFTVLIPNGKIYREQMIDLKKDYQELRRYQDYNDNVLSILKDLQSKNRHIITAFDTSFNSSRFQQQHSHYFNSLKISEKVDLNSEKGFKVYEVNTTSQMNSPKSFYDFLDAINKSNWIVGVDFPIYFKRVDETIKSSFTMKVYYNKDDLNNTNTKELNITE